MYYDCMMPLCLSAETLLLIYSLPIESLARFGPLLARSAGMGVQTDLNMAGKEKRSGHKRKTSKWSVGDSGLIRLEYRMSTNLLTH